MRKKIKELPVYMCSCFSNTKYEVARNPEVDEVEAEWLHCKEFLFLATYILLL